MGHTRRAFAGSPALAAAYAAGDVPRRKLGRTGLDVSVIGLGGARIGNLENGRAAIEVVRRCYDLGINYFDTAGAGAYGLSQARYGVALRGLRDKIVLSTKTRHRTLSQAQLDLDQSLANLKTDYLDLYQVHNVMNDEDIDFIFAKNGVMEMIERARNAGKIRHVGVTGHTTPAILNKILGLYPFATVLMPLSAADGGNSQKSFERETIPVARARGVGVIAMKTLGAGAMLQRKTATLEECLRYTWSLPVSTAIVGMEDIQQVESNVALARRATPMAASERAALRERAGRTAMASTLEPWKQSDQPNPEYRAD